MSGKARASVSQEKHARPEAPRVLGRTVACDLPEFIAILPDEAKFVQHCMADILSEMLSV